MSTRIVRENLTPSQSTTIYLLESALGNRVSVRRISSNLVEIEIIEPDHQVIHVPDYSLSCSQQQHLEVLS